MITIGNIKGVRQEHQITVFRASDNLPYLQVVMSSDAKQPSILYVAYPGRAERRNV